jgi:uncharacterized protein (DUF433 family)
MDLTNYLGLGNGIYTMPDVSNILGVPNSIVNRYVGKYWDEKFGKYYDKKYSWSVDLTKAVNFFTLVELYTFFQISDTGVKTKRIINAHIELSEILNTPYPFALQEVIENISTDGNTIFFNFKGKSLLELNGSKQFNLDFIKVFFKKLDFGDNSLASRLWLMGKEKEIICDPKRRFGLPIILGTNIHPETIFNMFQAGDSKQFISETFEITLKQIEDAIEYCKKAA